MATGKRKTLTSPNIIHTLKAAEVITTGEIRVHVSRKWFEKDAFKEAQQIFIRYGMQRTTDRNAVLIYVNPRIQQFAILADFAFVEQVGAKYWDELGENFKEDLRSTHPDNAISLAARTLAATLARYFPKE